MLTNCIQTNKSILKQKEKKASDIFYLRYCFTFSRMWYNWYHAVYNLFQTERFVFNPWLGKIPWRRERLATPLFWPGEFHGLYSLWSHKESNTTERLSLSLSKSGIRSNGTFKYEIVSSKQYVGPKCVHWYKNLIPSFLTSLGTELSIYHLPIPRCPYLSFI